jgi:activating signal cointegrator 1
MKALTLTQPWASLVALGKKRIETRSWETLYRGPLLIHAGKGLGPVGGMHGLVELVRQDVFWDALIPLRPSVFNAEGLAKRALPFGAIVAVCDLVDCVLTWPSWASDEPWFTGQREGETWAVPPPAGSDERAFGDYSPGRFAWLLANVRALPKPIPATGARRLWEWEGELSL